MGNYGASGDPLSALKIAISDPPYGTKNNAIRARSAALVTKVLVNIKEKDLDGVIARFSPAEQDVLMKYVYRGLEPGDNSTHLLKVHEVITKRAGVGCICRVLSTDAL